QLLPQNAQSYLTVKPQLALFVLYDSNFLDPLILPQSDPSWNTPYYVQEVYSTRLWELVKLWEINQEFGLEGMPNVVFGSQASSRAWYSNFPFFVSPNMLTIPKPSVGLGNGLLIVHTYLSMAWYQVQLLLNDGNGTFTGNNPIDWPYVYGYPEALG